jgi:prepilin-type N-terminal cleavage/methylation domain-containing protein
MSRRRGRGFTLVEVLVAAVLVGVFATISAGAARFVGTSTAAMRERARATTELRMATEYLRQDLGAAESVEIAEGDALRITRRPACARLAGSLVHLPSGDADAGVRYALRDARLVRTEIASGTEVVVAMAMTAFTLSERSDDEIGVYVAAGHGPERRAVTLVWRQP